MSKSRPRHPKISLQRLFAAVEAERRNLSIAESVLGCMAGTLDSNPELSANAPNFADVANLVSKMISGSIERLDSVYLSNPVDQEQRR